MTNEGGTLLDSEELMQTVMTKISKASENSVTVTSRRLTDTGHPCVHLGRWFQSDGIRTLSQGKVYFTDRVKIRTDYQKL